MAFNFGILFFWMWGLLLPSHTDPGFLRYKYPDPQVKEGSGWQPLFNGRNLDGWKVKIAGYPLGTNFGSTFRVQDSLLRVRYDAYGDDFNDRFGALYFDQKLTDYRLRVTYRFTGTTAPGAPEWGFRDSGIQFHSQPPETIKQDQAFPICLEYNLHGGNGRDERPVGEICANGMFVEINGAKNSSYCTEPFLKRTYHGDEWVTLEIDVKGQEISHYVNGEKILSYSNPTYDPENEIARNFIKNGNMTVTEGYISLQSNSHPIDIKEIELFKY